MIFLEYVGSRASLSAEKPCKSLIYKAFYLWPTIGTRK